ncbi:hypothetical protein Tco_1019809 [Tanacetum coccineum]|uniref:Uncharacterized protein n=1 Tax=Tanacetum coccineum TaxID=301880 RepID=A0ABQ5FZW0_9ASTR
MSHSLMEFNTISWWESDRTCVDLDTHGCGSEQISQDMSRGLVIFDLEAREGEVYSGGDSGVVRNEEWKGVSHGLKFMWGNSNYDYVFSVEAAGNSGGILWIWEESFQKYYVTSSDSFVTI